MHEHVWHVWQLHVWRLQSYVSTVSRRHRVGSTASAGVGRRNERRRRRRTRCDARGESGEEEKSIVKDGRGGEDEEGRKEGRMGGRKE